MPTDKPRFTITVDPALMQEIEDYRYNHRIKNQTQAVISLMQRGLQEIMETEFSQPQQPVEQYSADEQQLIDDYRSVRPCIWQNKRIKKCLTFSIWKSRHE